MIVSYWLFPKGDHCRKTAWTNALSFKVQVKQITLITLQYDTTSFSLHRSKRKQTPRLNYIIGQLLSRVRDRKLGPLRHTATIIKSFVILHILCRQGCSLAVTARYSPSDGSTEH